jgi:hypothetical protein
MAQGYDLGLNTRRIHIEHGSPCVIGYAEHMCNHPAMGEMLPETKNPVCTKRNKKDILS